MEVEREIERERERERERKERKNARGKRTLLKIERLEKEKKRKNSPPHLVEGLEDDSGELVGGARGSGDRGRGVAVLAARGGRATRADNASDNGGGGGAGGRAADVFFFFFFLITA